MTTADPHRFGATCNAAGTHFRVWAPTKRRVELCIETPGAACTYELTAGPDGFFENEVADAHPGDRYRYRVDGQGPFPDPASRFQPSGVHGPSEIIDPNTYVWHDDGWHGIEHERLVIYELHVGTFTPRGTYAAAAERLPYLRDLGITAIELMPVSDFPGERNWGYDVAALFAPARSYGRPDDLRRLIDHAHRHALGVLLDVVYNHLGPDGAYQPSFSPFYFSPHHRTPWGPAINLDGPHSRPVREFFIANACYWLREFHVDGLRLDATHALIDDGPVHFLAELSQRVRQALHPRDVLLIAEDHRNDVRLLRPVADGGYDLDAVWADDFHHQVRRHLAGDHEGYYAAYSGALEDIAATIRRGWFYCGQTSPPTGNARGTDPTGLAPTRFVVCLQNHDQVGNRAFGDRLHHQIDPAAYRAATVLLLGAPETPLLFMGQEWAARTPFLFFTDHRPPLGAQVSQGRRREFRAFSAFADARARETIPDPQQYETFAQSRLNWAELGDPAQAAVHNLYRALLRTSALRSKSDGFDCGVIAGTLALLRWNTATATLLVVNLDGSGDEISVESFCRQHLRIDLNWSIALHTEDPTFAPDPMPVQINIEGYPVVSFPRPGAVVLTATARAGSGCRLSPA